MPAVQPVAQPSSDEDEQRLGCQKDFDVARPVGFAFVEPTKQTANDMNGKVAKQATEQSAPLNIGDTHG